MTVHELIERLQQEPNQEKEVDLHELFLMGIDFASNHGDKKKE